MAGVRQFPYVPSAPNDARVNRVPRVPTKLENGHAIVPAQSAEATRTFAECRRQPCGRGVHCRRADQGAADPWKDVGVKRMHRGACHWQRTIFRLRSRGE